MKRTDRSEFYKQMVQDLARVTPSHSIAQQLEYCEDCKRDTMHYVYRESRACSKCVAQSITMAELGRRGGLNGGKSKSVRKLEALQRNSRNRWKK